MSIGATAVSEIQRLQDALADACMAVAILLGEQLRLAAESSANRVDDYVRLFERSAPHAPTLPKSTPHRRLKRRSPAQNPPVSERKKEKEQNHPHQHGPLSGPVRARARAVGSRFAGGGEETDDRPWAHAGREMEDEVCAA